MMQLYPIVYVQWQKYLTKTNLIKTVMGYFDLVKIALFFSSWYQNFCFSGYVRLSFDQISKILFPN